MVRYGWGGLSRARLVHLSILDQHLSRDVFEESDRLLLVYRSWRIQLRNSGPLDCGGLQCNTLDLDGRLHLHGSLLLSEEVPDRTHGIQADSNSGPTGSSRIPGRYRPIVHSDMARVRERLLESARSGNNGFLGIPV